MKYALAIDIGASSGRHILGWIEDNKLFTKEISFIALMYQKMVNVWFSSIMTLL